MSRIDVVPAEKGKFAVLVNMGCGGRFEYHSSELANQEARKYRDAYHPTATLKLISEDTK